MTCPSRRAAVAYPYNGPFLLTISPPRSLASSWPEPTMPATAVMFPRATGTADSRSESRPTTPGRLADGAGQVAKYRCIVHGNLLLCEQRHDRRHQGWDRQHLLVRRKVRRPRSLCRWLDPSDNESIFAGDDDDSTRWTAVIYPPLQDRAGDSYWYHFGQRPSRRVQHVLLRWFGPLDQLLDRPRDSTAAWATARTACRSTAASSRCRSRPEHRLCGFGCKLPQYCRAVRDAIIERIGLLGCCGKAG